MKDFKILKLLDKIRFVFLRMGIDYSIMRKILQAKLVMDERRIPTIMMNQNQKESKSSFKGSLLVYAFMGLMIGIFMFLPFPVYLKMNIIIGMLIFMIMSTMVSDFSGVLLDINDKNILLTRPVDAKTLSMAKLIHIVYYLSSITMAIAGPSLVFGLIKYGVLFFLLFLVEVIFMCGFIILLTALLYYAILSVFSGEKLKDIINYFQIVLTIFMTVMYQFIGRLFNFVDMKMKVEPHIWNFILPSTWFAAPLQLLTEHTYNKYFILLSITGLIIPVITLILYIKVVTPRFERKLLKLNSSGSKAKIKKDSLARKLSNLICFQPQEKVFFRFALQMLNNERKIKLKLYPGFAFSLIFPFIFMINMYSGDQSFTQFWTQIRNGRYYLYLYLSVMMFTTMFSVISSSENYKGAWIYKALPVEHPAIIIKAAFKGFIFRFVVPIYLFVSTVFVLIFGLKIIPDVMLIFLNMLVIMLVFFTLSKKELPFGKDFKYAQNNNIGIVLLAFLLCGILAGVHYLMITLVPYGLLMNMGASLIFVILLWHLGFKISWKSIEV